MKKKLRGALALVLSALMMLAPITGASAAQTFDLSSSILGYPVSWWEYEYGYGMVRWSTTENIYSGDVLSSSVELGRSTGYPGDSVIRYWDGDGYGSGTAKTAKISGSSEKEAVANGRWRAVNAVSSGDSDGFLDLEAVGATVSGYPKSLGNQELYMFVGVNTQPYGKVETKKQHYAGSDYTDEYVNVLECEVLPASEIRAQFKNMYPSMAMNFYEAALYEEVEYDNCTDTVGEVVKYTILREVTPEKAVELVFPYPKGYGVESNPDDIKVLHAVEEKRVLKEETTYPYEGAIYTNTVTESSAKFVEEQFTLEADGIHVKTDKLSPFAVAYVSSEQPPVEDQPNEDVKGADLPRTGDSSMLMLWVGLMSASAVALFAARRRRA